MWRGGNISSGFSVSRILDLFSFSSCIFPSILPRCHHRFSVQLRKQASQNAILKSNALFVHSFDFWSCQCPKWPKPYVQHGIRLRCPERPQWHSRVKQLISPNLKTQLINCLMQESLRSENPWKFNTWRAGAPVLVVDQVTPAVCWPGFAHFTLYPVPPAGGQVRFGGTGERQKNQFALRYYRIHGKWIIF